MPQFMSRSIPQSAHQSVLCESRRTFLLFEEPSFSEQSSLAVSVLGTMHHRMISKTMIHIAGQIREIEFSKYLKASPTQTSSAAK